MNTPILPPFEFWKKINPARIMIDGTTWKKWFLPDLTHAMEFRVSGDKVIITVTHVGTKAIEIAHSIALVSVEAHNLLNQACVLAEHQFVRTDPAAINRYKSGR